ncbi:DUF429 domain-containing protein [Rhizobium leguminosarum bv. viciae]|nr:DUF429 domain-containing protein [Rhizobium leguminosarum bv. viciae]
MNWIDTNSPYADELRRHMRDITNAVEAAVHVYGDDPRACDEEARRLVSRMSRSRKDCTLPQWRETLRLGQKLSDVVERIFAEIVRAGILFDLEEERRSRRREAHASAAMIPRPKAGKHFTQKLAGV